jgi:eukaryotic-like serine/threonine-protein kinase
MPLPAGTRLGPYEILAPLGAGGMGEVYRAKDPRLDRDVAIKVLPARLSTGPDALARFEREAKAVAALSHPNILAIHDFGRHDGELFAVTELLEGKTLRERLAGGRLPSRKAVEYAIQIANGLAAAHEKGIVHRDLKPENLFITDDGRLKILDFGLARVVTGPADETHSPTAVAATEPGTVMGTVGYMSPEQVRGLPADGRSDIFSFGSVLYEMLGGQRAFRGDSAAETMAAIAQNDPPELSSPDQAFSPALDRVVRHCLEKAPGERFQSARDVAFDLQSLAVGSGASAGVAIARLSRWKRRLLFSTIGTLGLVLAWTLGRWTASRDKVPQGAPIGGRFTMLTDQPGVERSPDLAPDGKSFVYVSDSAGKDDIYFQRVGGRNTTNLTKDSSAADYAPTFSPDGEKIAFRSERDGGGIYVMGATGESVRRLTDFGFDPAWSPGGDQIVVATEPVKDPTSRAAVSQLWAVETATAKKRLVLERDGVGPRWSPHGFRVAYWGLPRDVSKSQGQRDIWTVAADGSQAKGGAVAVTNDPAFDWSPEWSPDGRFLYFASDRGGTMNLWRVAIEEKSGRVLGGPEPVTTPSTWASHFRFSRGGREMVFGALDERSTIFRIGFDPAAETVSGAPVPVLKGSRRFSTLDLSSDGKWIVFDSPKGSREDLFLVRSDGSDYRQLIDEPFQHRVPRWSPDGSRIAFYSNRGGKPEAWGIRPDGSGLERIASNQGVYRAWSPDGRRMAMGAAFTEMLLFDVSQSPEREVGKLASRLEPWSWSPDGQRIAGNFDRPDRSSAVGVFSFATGRDTIIDQNGRGPLWLSDGVRLLYEKQGAIVLFDTRTGRTKQIVPRGTVTPGWAMKFSLSKDDRQLVYLQTQRDGDIWMMSLDPNGAERKR